MESNAHTSTYPQHDGAGLAEWARKIGMLQAATKTLESATPAQLLCGVHVLAPTPAGGTQWLTIGPEKSPNCFTGMVKLQDVESFLAYLKRHATASWSSVYLQVHFGTDTPLRAVAVLDDHGSTPGWKAWRAELVIGIDPQTMAVIKACSGTMTQQELAEVIEDNEDFIFDPPAARMLEIALSLKVTQSCRLKQGLNLHNGDREVELFSESTAVAGKADSIVKIPETMTLRVAMFQGQPPRDLVLKFRYRANTNHTDRPLLFQLSCPGLQHVLKRAAEELAEELRAGSPCPVYLGTLVE